MVLGEKIRELRLERELLQRELAKNIHIASNTLSQFESGKAKPSYEVLIALADFFEVSVDYLLGREDDFGNITIQTAGAQLTTDERKLIEDYRDLTPALQKMLRATIETWKGSDANESKKRRDIQPRRA